jgi:DUF4097 and DUF4098 domain-containing protein YvlB
MKENCCTVLALCVCLASLLGFCGCDIQIGDWPRAKYERIVQRRASIAPNSTLVAETRVGSISIAGADVSDCNVVATISARAPTEEEAKELAEAVQIQLEPSGKTLAVRAHKPTLKRNRSISISYDITVPRQTDVECSSSYGPIKLANLDGNVQGKTSSGSVEAHNIQGSANLETSYGSIKCTDVSGDTIKLKSSSGSITAESVRGSAQLDTSYGSITCRDISGGDVRLKTSSGKITLSKASFGDCDVDTSYGSITSDELDGNSIKLYSGSGSINVIKAAAKTTDISTSYGRITCRDIETSEFTAKSGSGNIEVVCSRSAPADIVATAITSYGSIDFAAPPNFCGQVDLSTSYGSVKTELPVTLTGELGRKKIKGNVGEGNGRLYLKTSSGSISLKPVCRQAR